MENTRNTPYWTSLGKMEGAIFVTKAGLKINKSYFIKNANLLNAKGKICIDPDSWEILKKRLLEREDSLDNNSKNRYIMREFDRLYRYARLNQEVKFQNKMCHMLNSSLTLKLAVINHTYPKWYHWSDKKFRFILNSLGNMYRKLRCNYRFRRVYIPKPNSTKMRPLAVPDWRSRLICGTQLIFLDIWSQGREMITERQYATKGKGTPEAIKNVIEMIKTSRYKVYEFDIEKFYDKISRRKIFWRLLVNNVPPMLIEWIMVTFSNSNNSIAILDKLKEDREIFGWKKERDVERIKFTSIEGIRRMFVEKEKTMI
jgi:hypothetical protein